MVESLVRKLAVTCRVSPVRIAARRAGSRLAASGGNARRLLCQIALGRPYDRILADPAGLFEVPRDRGQRMVTCGGEVLCRQGPGLDRGDVSVDGMLPQAGAVVLDLDEAKDIGASRLVRSQSWCRSPLSAARKSSQLRRYRNMSPFFPCSRRPNSLISVRYSREVYSEPRSECAMQPPFSPPRRRHPQRVDDEPGPMMVGHRIANDLAGGQVDHRGEIPPPASVGR